GAPSLPVTGAPAAGAPSLPGLPSLPALPSLPSLSSLPGLPGLPGGGAFHKARDLPSVPGVPKVPKVPIPAVPKVEKKVPVGKNVDKKVGKKIGHGDRGVPSVPGVPKVPKVPIPAVPGVKPPTVKHEARQDTSTLPSGIQRPPQLPIVYNDTVASINATFETYIQLFNETVQRIIDTVVTDNATFNNTILPYLRAQNLAHTATDPLSVYEFSDKPAEVNDAVNSAQAVMDNASDDIFTNEAFFALVDHIYQATGNATDGSLAVEEQIVLEKVWRYFAGAGLNIPAGAQRDQFQAANRRLSEIYDEFSANVFNGSSTVLYFTADELEGVDPQTISQLNNGTGENAGKLEVPVTDLAYDILQDAVNETTRYAESVEVRRLYPENVALIQEAIQLRVQVAQLAGYESWDDYAIHANMAKTKQAVTDFLADVTAHVQVKADAELQEIKDVKSKNGTIVSPIGDEDIAYKWDYDYYATIRDAEKYGARQGSPYQYWFPANVTVPATLEFYGEIYGTRYDRIQGQDADALSPTGNGTDLVWHPDVWLYAVYDSQAYIDAHPEVTDHFRGYLYLDLFKRPVTKAGGGSFMEPLSPGFVKEDGCLQYPTAGAFLFEDKSDDETKIPSFIEDSTTLFHELGHCHHQLLSRTTYYSTHGPVGTPIDFIEFPSQFMEMNYGRIYEVYERISAHWSSFSAEAAAAWRKETGADESAELPPVTYPKDLFDRNDQANRGYVGSDTIEQIFYATYDQTLHGYTSLEAANTSDVTAIFNTLTRNITQVPDPIDIGKGPDWSFGETKFQHIVWPHYTGAYYGYQWALVYAEDVFYTAFVDDPFSSEAGFRYRTEILQPGGARDPNDSLEAFLGRAPNNEGFYKYLGVPA
ncbi:hypothetical protein TI39_contig4102g00010, partial [Zymoseptoria brevis]